MKNKSFFANLVYCLFFAVTVFIVSCRPDDDPDPINPGPVTAAFVTNLTANCPTPCQVCFTNNSVNATAYSWDFGNGQTSTEVSPCVTYNERGSFTVTLTASNGTASNTSTQTLTIGDNVDRYKRTFNASATGEVTHLLRQNGFTYVLMKVDGIYKLVRFNDTGESSDDLPSSMEVVTDMVGTSEGDILLTGQAGSPSVAKFMKLTEDAVVIFESEYSTGYATTAYSAVVKNTSAGPGYIIGGNSDDGSYNEGLLINAYDDGSLYFQDPVEYVNTVNRIFRNPDDAAPYIAIGSWFDPLQQKLDIKLTGINENGEDFLPVIQHLGLDNSSDDWVNDAVQYGDGRQYAGVGSLGGKPAFFMVNWETQQFSQPVATQGFLPGVTILRGVCALANGQGFGVVGTEYTATSIRLYVAKLDAGGSILWQKTYDDYTIGSDIVATPDGGFLVGGQEICDNLACNYPILYKLDGNGDFE
ncbi:MAG: PKD domain-containing protein [Saprospiraceae bacterium]|nr:PKD domain-containing protein [Saprospiraceae bacterium]